MASTCCASRAASSGCRSSGDTLPNDPFQNPLLFLVPALGVFALTLVMLRVLPLVMRAVAGSSRTRAAWGCCWPARHLARTPGFYTAPLVLLVLTLSLSAFTASLAQTLDNHLYDQSYYQVGADMRLDELGQGVAPTDAYTGGTSAGRDEGRCQQPDEGPTLAVPAGYRAPEGAGDRRRPHVSGAIAVAGPAARAARQRDVLRHRPGRLLPRRLLARATSPPAHSAL